MNTARTVFYVILAVVFPLFFLLHWNGMFAGTYYWFLIWTGKTDSGLFQMLAALVSTITIFVSIVLVYEVFMRLIGSGKKKMG